MAQELALAAATVALVGVVLALITRAVAQKNLTAALIMSPLSVVASIAAGLWVALELMLFEGTTLATLIVAVTAPVALAVGVVVTMRTQAIIEETRARLEAAERDRAIEQGKRQLMSWLGHDVRTPLAGIRAMAEALEDGVVPKPEHYYAKIIAEAKRTSEMVEEMMRLASLQTGTLHLTPEALELHDLLSDGVSHVQHLAEARGMNFEAHMCPELLECRADAALLARALQNILANAITYSAPRSTLEVYLDRITPAELDMAIRAAAPRCAHSSGGARSSRSASESGVRAYARIRVVDNCGGIDDATHAHMFDVGWRASEARTPGTGSGGGLGLPIVKTIVEAHGGEVFVTPLPQACCVTLALPLSESTKQSPANSDDAAGC